MNREEFDSHSVWRGVEDAAEMMAAVDATKDLEAIRSIDPLRRLVSETRAVGEADPDLTTQTMLDRLSNGWAQVQSYFANYQANPNPSYLRGAEAQGDVIRDALAIVPRPIAHGGAQARVTRAFNEYRKELDLSRERLVERLGEAIAAAQMREAELQSRIDTLAADVDLKSRELQELEARVAQASEQVTNAGVSQAEAFTSAQFKRDTDFRDWLAQQGKEFDRLADPHLKSLVEAESAGRSHLAEIEGLRTSTVEMSHLAAGDILATKYGDYASSERKTALWCYLIGAAFALAGMCAVAWLFGGVASTLSWQQVTLKLAVTLGASGVAAMAFRTAGLAVRRATSFKRQELELRALQPLLAEVDGADRAKTAFLKRAFGHAWTDSQTDKTADPEQLADLLKALVPLLQQSQKATGTS